MSESFDTSGYFINNRKTKEEMCMVAMMQSIVLLLVGFVLLIKGADFLLRKFFRCKGSADSVYDCRTHDRCNGDEPAGTCC